MAGSLRALIAFGELSDAVAVPLAVWLYERLTKSGRTALALRRLTASGHLTTSPAGQTDGRVVRLTEAGRQAVLGGIDPVQAWARPWDGKWRLVAFDVPEKEAALRARLRRHLKRERFGWLQNSMWISPDPLTPLRSILGEQGIAPDSLLLLEARPVGGESHQAIVASAWDWKRIDRVWQTLDDVLDQAPADAGAGPAAARRWLDAYLRAWRAVRAGDPFLPRVLWPESYAPETVWAKRRAVLGAFGRQLRAAAESAVNSSPPSD